MQQHTAVCVSNKGFHFFLFFLESNTILMCISRTFIFALFMQIKMLKLK